MILEDDEKEQKEQKEHHEGVEFHVLHLVRMHTPDVYWFEDGIRQRISLRRFRNHNDTSHRYENNADDTRILGQQIEQQVLLEPVRR